MVKIELLVVVPLYKSPELIEGLFGSLIDNAAELKRLNAQILLINDSPDHGGLAQELEDRLPGLHAATNTQLLVNEENVGFVVSCNKGFDLALDLRADVLLLNSDALLTPGALTELAAVSRLDPMTAVVSPRSNNATICNSPYPDRFRDLGVDAALDAHQTIQSDLPRVTYVPTSVGFCLYIRWEMIREFGRFDTIYGGGYNEENDFIMRCNRRGYRAVLANHAFVHHLGSISFTQSDVAPSHRELKNRAILLERYPEYERAVTRYFASIEFRSQTLLAGLIPGAGDKPRLLFECSNIGPHHNGTFELAVKVIRAFVQKHRHTYDFYIACSHPALVFHGLDQIVGLQFCWNREMEMGPFTYAVRLAQPFQIDHLIALSDLAPITSFLILDTIAMDCQNLDDQRLGRVWTLMLKTTAVLGYISDYSKDQFHRRFHVPRGVTEYVALCSTQPSEYATSNVGETPSNGSILLVGNHFSHKHVLDTLALLRLKPDRPPVVVLGLEVPDEEGVTSYHAGELEQSLVDRLYDEAAVVLFPSHYEGFGFPMTHALGREKPVIAREMPVFREIIARAPGSANVQLFRTTQEMVDAACALPAWNPRLKKVRAQSWKNAAETLHLALAKARAEFTYQGLRDRMLHIETCRAWLAADQQTAHWQRQALAGGTAPAINGAPPARQDPVTAFSDAAASRIRSALSALGRFKPLSAVGRAYWRTQPAGRMLKTTPGDDLPTGMRRFGHIQVRSDAPVSQEQFIDCALDWARLLVMNGEALIDLPVDGTDKDPMSPSQAFGLRAWLGSAGFEVIDLQEDGERLRVSAIKTRDWTAILPGEPDVDAFLHQAFQATLGRAPEGLGAQHVLNELGAGASRQSVLKHLHSSLERAIKFSGDTAMAD